MTLSSAEAAAARAFRAAQRAQLEAMDPPDITVSVVAGHQRHDCAARDGRSFALELKERYVYSPELWVCYCGSVGPHSDDFPHWDCQGSVMVPARRFAWIFKAGRCSCKMTARSGAGRLVDPAVRPPAPRAAVSG